MQKRTCKSISVHGNPLPLATLNDAIRSLMSRVKEDKGVVDEIVITADNPEIHRVDIYFYG